MTGPSIHRNLLAWVMGALALGAALLIGGSWWVLANEMDEVFEDNLKQVALAVAHHAGAGSPAGPAQLAQALPRAFEEYGRFEFVTAVWSLEGRLLHSSDPAVHLPFLSRSGISQVMADGQPWHLYTVVLHDRIVQAAQLASERRVLARETASGLVLPTAGLLALIALLLALALRRGLAPLSAAAQDVAALSVEALHPIELRGHPRELHPLVSAVNDLMVRLGSALSVQRHFVADAAHELRTPIAALRLQLQLLERAADAGQRRIALAELGAGIDRAQHMVAQLLQLSRLGPEAPALQPGPVVLGELVREAVARFSARADAAGIDLGAEVAGAPVVQGDAAQLASLLDNLVDNALRHTPQGGRVDVRTDAPQGRPCLEVCDTGHGIPIAERERVFDRFYRGAGQQGVGTGLGLAIVRAVADSHHADVALADAPGGGLCVRVRFPPS
ncbi:ATP-binding protein [Ramlibacter tataouinensis]|uniref:sensor histidine kinase n=1 Tax=Ramlibacter tataouinensis TaxID=94132 RepID=UPI0022F3E508|nr:ATP-binding protein [Ramlibacter tataouinensis]WBY01649.1 ATP-binding protein [Ramlibacter tataouinensis]